MATKLHARKVPMFIYLRQATKFRGRNFLFRGIEPYKMSALDLKSYKYSSFEILQHYKFKCICLKALQVLTTNFNASNARIL